MTVQLKKWTGKFGKKYTARNICSLAGLEKFYNDTYGVSRKQMNGSCLSGISRSSRILEVGCNLGSQLSCLRKMGFKNLYGIEPQDCAIELSKKRTRGINIIKGDAFDIPFKDGYFDIVFTSGVLIHINPMDIKKALKEIYRCSRKYIWGFEYYADTYKEVVYRGQRHLLWKTDFAKLYMDNFKDLRVVKMKFFKYLSNENVDAMYLLEKNE